MSIPMTRLAKKVVRAWVRMYVVGLPANERAERLAEIDSDLWEHVCDGDAAGHGAFRISLQVMWPGAFEEHRPT